ncbi:putative serine protease K12H4.7 [Choanephora cucurbitarum]|uniref:Putative serine protease K12H4.7 n=1 Tax=Choanephora cucurbitarum TaxID=101091 RepID=A0A1C7NQ89_9FUNG|nr:putative serine protease K12H4.7 [Choanephora cucurbitarum]
MILTKSVIGLVLLSINCFVSGSFLLGNPKLGKISHSDAHARIFSASNRPANETAEKESLPARYGTFYMDMPLDHFAKDNVTFRNRYWVNTDYYQPNGPIIFANGGEAAVDSPAFTMVNTTMAQLAKKLNGAFIFMEHRFYGDSRPLANGFNYSTEVISKLNTDQALADMAYLLKNVKFADKEIPSVPETKVIVYGCSYSGNLAAWMKRKYPELVYAAVASSAPVQAQFDFYQYFDPIIRYGRPACIQAIEQMIAYVDKILSGSSTQAVNELKQLYGVPDLYDDDFASYLTTAIASYWQYGVSATNDQFEELICKKTFNSSSVEENAKSYANLLRPYVNQTYCEDYKDMTTCLDSHNATSIQEQKATNPDNAAWMYQTCTEYGYFQTASPKGYPTVVSRKLDIKWFERTCKLYFGNQVPKRPKISEFNKKYKGWNINLDRILWIDGEYDNWRELSVHSPSVKRSFDGNQTLSIIIPKATHCLNYNGITEKTPQYLRDIQELQYTTLKKWLDQAN